MAKLEVLEEYADEFSATSGKDKNLLMINFIRTGVDRYRDGNWSTLAGAEITEFTEYVELKDAQNGTTVMDLRDIVIDDFSLPNGNKVDFGHMFGTMNIAYVASAATADLGGWAGDICDLILYSKHFGNVPAGTVDEMADYVLTNCFGVNADDAFGMDDFYGDMDAFYLYTNLKADASSMTALMSEYFTETLCNEDRAAYFLNNRFDGLATREDVRTAIYDTYTSNTGLMVLEADRGISDEDDLRQASCYAFADYLYNLAGDSLEGGSGKGEEDDNGNGYYSIFSSTESILAPGITQKINYAVTTDNKQIVYYVATVDVTRDDVTIMVNYKDNDPSKGWGTQRVEDQATALVNKYKNKYEHFNAIVATNADGYNMSTGEPGGLLIMDGREWKGVDKDGFFAILDDGSAVIGTQADYETYRNRIKEAVGGFGAVLIKDGEIVTTNNSGRASRTAIGIKADGSVVMMVLDGRQEPFSAGGSMREIAQIMYEAGCVEAINLDGGGSTTYLSKPEGSDSLKLINKPSDGYARSVATSLVAISTAKSSNEFYRATVSSDYDYLTIGTKLQMSAIGISNTGNAAALPADATWTVSDPTVGSITSDGVFTALANGEVEVQLVSKGEVVGTKTLYVVVPDTLEIEGGSVTAVFGIPTKIPVIATYNGEEVAINESDIFLGAVEETAGVFEGFMFTGDENVGIRNVTAAAVVMAVDDVGVMFNINLYYADEAYFDFENATAGNLTLAWLREVANSITKDNSLYEIVLPGQDMDVSYTFALDMKAIPIPDKLAGLTDMLPGADQGSTAFQFLLQLAERVSVLTEVKIEAQFDTDLDVDISGLKIVNDYFELAEATVDENNKLTMICKWIDRTQAIDPATANSICILTGITATPKDSAWDDNGETDIINHGTVSYDIYLRASSLYSFAQKAENQATYGLYPYSTDQTGYEGGTESGAHFRDTYAEFADTYTLDSSLKQGWHEQDGDLLYYKDNVPLTGVQYLPSYEDPSVKLYYTFGDNGICNGKVMGAFEVGGKYYYAWLGEKRTGWQAVTESDGNSYYYYFSPYRNGAAIESGRVGIDGIYYTFENCRCVLGSLVTTSAGRVRYSFAGSWQRNQWVEMDGKKYFLANDYYCVQNTVSRVRNFEATANEYLAFDEKGVWMEDESGLRFINGSLYLLENGKLISRNIGLKKIGEDYYYFRSNGAAVVNATYWVTNTNNLFPQGSYYFDENGKMSTPTADDGEKLNGVVEVGGKYYYYIDGAIVGKLGVLKLTDESGEDYYIYVRTDGSLATGRYWITKHNDLLPMQAYDFGTNGRYYPSDEPSTPVVPDTPDVLNGIVEENGEYYYYEDGKLSYLGLVKLTDESGETFYIYVRSNGKLAIGRYWPTKHNDVLPLTGYDFGTNGRYYPSATTEPQPPVNPDSPAQPGGKNGIVDVDGVLYYYENGKPTYKGLIKLEDEEGKTYYVYARSNGQLALGRYWPTRHNDLLPYAGYDFGTDGRYYPAN
ncbi:MAG: phosphodiester glycosidase family protein [Clostridia bacterium]|nr:phosphodiester glycosidase family protein [Clostridia bacterium]